MERAGLGLLVVALAVVAFSSHFIEGSPGEEIPMSEVYGGDDVLLACVNSSWRLFDLVIWMKHENNNTIKIAVKEYGIGLDLINRGYRFVGPVDLFIPALTHDDTGLYSCQLQTARGEIVARSYVTLKVIVLCRLPKFSSHLRSRDCNFHHAVLVDGFCSFKCEQNYTLVGSHKLICLSSGRFSAPMPECHDVLVVRAYAGSDAYLPCNQTQLEDADTLFWIRYDGYTRNTLLSKTDGKTTIFEERTVGLVNDTALLIPFVRKDDSAIYQCKLVHKSSVEVYKSNATLEVIERCPWPERSPELQEFPQSCQGDFVSEGVNCSFKCKEGYLLSKNITLSCLPHGQFSDAVPSCEVVNCTIDKFDANLYSETEQCREDAVVPFGTTCFFSCGKERQLVNGNSIRTCQANATLSGKSGKCEETASKTGLITGLIIVVFIALILAAVVGILLKHRHQGVSNSTSDEAHSLRSED